MALTNRSLAGGSLQAASAFGAYPSPITYPGYLSGNSTSHSQGEVVVGTNGLLTKAAVGNDGAACLGILDKLSPRRQDQAPLTSHVLPAAALPGQKTTPAAGSPNYADIADPNFAVNFLPFIPGNIFAGHDTDEGGANGTDVRAYSVTDIYRQTGYTFTVASGAGADEINYATQAGLWVLAIGLGTDSACTRIMGYVNPQPTSVASGVFVDAPGNIVQNVGGSGTFNPFVIWVPTEGALWE